ncbi:two-component regulator propeller domain-containing protein, partial [Arthrospira platensis SPKY1]|nr:two-component regulator propeller domain-containing protein [Arthrospira platensis SPKY1]
LNLYFPEIAYFHRMDAPISIRHSVLLWLLLWAGMPLGWAQSYPYLQLTTTDGLPTNYVYGVVEDADGFIWAYTENGLAKYDGYGFRNFTTQDGLPGNDVVYAKADSLGRIWLQIYGNRPAY